MGRTLDQIREEVFTLTEEDRRKLADDILGSLPPAHEYSPEQIAEWERRLDDLRSGRDPGVTLEEFLGDEDL
jgi:putative addiction module component (TIGR02574 family)